MCSVGNQINELTKMINLSNGQTSKGQINSPNIISAIVNHIANEFLKCS
jgi:hypothetical protein